MRQGLRELGYQVLESPTAILPIIVGDTARAIRFSNRLLELGIFVIGFGFPVVPEGAARLRIQMSAAHTAEHITRAGGLSPPARRARVVVFRSAKGTFCSRSERRLYDAFSVPGPNALAAKRFPGPIVLLARQALLDKTHALHAIVDAGVLWHPLVAGTPAA